MAFLAKVIEMFKGFVADAKEAVRKWQADAPKREKARLERERLAIKREKLDLQREKIQLERDKIARERSKMEDTHESFSLLGDSSPKEEYHFSPGDLMKGG